MAVAIQKETVQPVAVLDAPKSIRGYLNDIFDDFSKRADQVLQNAIAEAASAEKQVLEEAAQQASLVIENAKSAYADSLKLTVEQVGGKIDEILDKIEKIIIGLEKKEEEIINQVGALSQQIVNSLPFSDVKPQLTSINPRYIAIHSAAQNVIVQFKGNFRYSGTEGYEPNLSMRSYACELIENGTQSLYFKVPVAALKPAENDPNNNINENKSIDPVNNFFYATGTLGVQWNNGYTDRWPFVDKVTNNFKVWLGMLPLSPGKITANFATFEEKQTTQDRVSTSWHARGQSQVSTSEAKFNVRASEGWKIAPNPQFVLEKELCNNYTRSIQTTPDEIIITVDLSGGKYVGDVYFHIDYVEYKVQEEKKPRQETLEMRWGDSKLVKPANDSESIDSITFEQFDGIKKEFPKGTFLDDPYLQLVDSGNYLMVTATVPKDNEVTPPAQSKKAPKSEKIALSSQEEEKQLLEDLKKMKLEAEKHQQAYLEKKKDLVLRVALLQLPKG